MFFKLATGGQYYAQNAQIDESVCEKIPANVELIYWDYYSADEAHYDGMIEAHQKLKPGGRPVEVDRLCPAQRLQHEYHKSSACKLPGAWRAGRISDHVG